jgi:hypothetical protein
MHLNQSSTQTRIGRQRGQSVIKDAISWVLVAVCVFVAGSPVVETFAQASYDFYRTLSTLLH